MAEYTNEQKAEWARAQYKKDRKKILARNKTKAVREYKNAWAREYRKKNLELVRDKQNSWVKARRLEWLEANGPCKKCGASKRLEVDHINPRFKVHHSVWTWSVKRRTKELKKCQVLCFLCHRLKTNEERGWKLHGEIRYQMGCRCEECIQVHKKKLRKQKRDKNVRKTNRTTSSTKRTPPNPGGQSPRIL